jgi:hypothetical protein
MVMKPIEPSFEIDAKGRVICQNHNNYVHFIDPDKDFFSEMYLDVELTCKTCEHYKVNECYISKERVDEIEYQRIEKKAYRCRLCFHRIHRMFTVMYKLYNKEKHEIDMPLICCDCYDDLFKGEFKREARERIAKGLVFFFVILIVFFGPALIIIEVLTNSPSQFIIVLIIGLIAMCIIQYYILKKLKHDISGILFYKKYLTQIKINEIGTKKTE